MTVYGSNNAILSPLPLASLPDNPLVSVLIANYNYAQYLGEAIDSVLRQSYGHLELIICDDGSTDNSCAVVQQFIQIDRRVTLVYQNNAGQGRALLSAYARCSGEIICLLDSDDVYLPTKLQRIVEAFRMHPEVGFIGHRVLRVTANGKQRGVLPLSVSNAAEWLGPMLLRNGGIARNLPSCSGLSMRRAVSDLIFPLFQDPALRGYYGDRVPKLVAPFITPVLVLKEPLARYRVHGDNRTGGAKMTVPFLDRELHAMQIGWELQQRYLAAEHPAQVKDFAPIQSLLTFWLMRYMRERLLNSSELRHAYHQVIQHPEFRQEPWFLQWFWKGSIFLPRVVFQRAIDILMGAGIIKQAAALAVHLLDRKGQ